MLETTGDRAVALSKVLGAAEVLDLQEVVRRVPAPPSVVDLAVGLARSTRPLDGAPDFIKKWVAWGAGPRASQALVLGAKARALLEGRLAVDASDVLRIARPILRHRVVLNFQAEAEGVRVDEVIGKLISS